MTIYHIFSPFYFKWTVPAETQKILREKVNNYIEENPDKFGRPDPWKCEVKTSFNHMLIPDKNTDTIGLENFFTPFIKDLLTNLGWNSIQKTKNSYWINIYESGHYQENHDHVPHKFSGVYFLKFNPWVHGRIVFQNPLKQSVQYGYVEQWGSSANKMSYFNCHIPADVTEGDLIIFPSSLIHSVERGLNQGDEKRITIAFNVDF